MRIDKDYNLDDVIIGSHKRPHIMMSIPTLGMVPIEFMFATGRLQMPINGMVIQHLVKGMEVGKARDKAVKDLLNFPKEHRPDWLFFLGDDMIPEWNAFTELYKAATEENWDLLTGMYFWKGEPPTPLIWRDDHIGRMEPNKHFTVGDRVWCDLTGMDFTLIRTSLLEKMEPPYFKTGPSLRAKRPTQLEPWIIPNSVVMHTEDTWFCSRAKAVGAKMGVHTGVRVGHLDVKSGNIY